MSTLTIFHLFPNLPTEIRLKIWSFALSVPRIVTITCNREAAIRGGPRTAKSWATDTPIPPLLLVNRESRYEALKIYAPYFILTASSCSRPIYLSFSQDTPKLVDNVLRYIPSSTLVEIRKMILRTKDCAYFGSYNIGILRNMKMLRELEIYAERGVVRRGNEGDQYLDSLMVDFTEAKGLDPSWDCPEVRIFDGETGEKRRVIEGGPKVPGWKPSEEGIAPAEVG